MKPYIRKCVHCGAETPNVWPHDNISGLCNGPPLVSGTPEHDAAYAECRARRNAQDNAIRSANAAEVERVYGGLPLGLVAVYPAPGDTVEWSISTENPSPEVGKVVDDGDDGEITIVFPFSGIVRLRRYRNSLVLSDGCRENGYALWLNTPQGRPGDRSWSIKYHDYRTPQVVAVDVVAVVTIRGAS